MSGKKLNPLPTEFTKDQEHEEYIKTIMSVIEDQVTSVSFSYYPKIFIVKDENDEL